MDMITPRPKPCGTCPYRRDVPSGIWAEGEYDKLAQYDNETPYQPMGVFMCHQADGKVCSGWASVSGDVHSLALRLARGIDPDIDVQAVLDYTSPVPCFGSGTEAAEHGKQDIEQPSEEALEAVAKIAGTRKRQGKPVNLA